MRFGLSTCKMGTILSWQQRQFSFFDVRKCSRLHEPTRVCKWQETSWENATLLLQGTIERGPKKNFYCPNMTQMQETSCHYTSGKLLPLDSKLANWPEGTGHNLCCISHKLQSHRANTCYPCMGEAVIVISPPGMRSASGGQIAKPAICVVLGC